MNSNRRGARGSNSRDMLLSAVALQDHVSRTLRMPGSGKHPSTTRPGTSLTLAQRMGLVERPPNPLTDSDWKAVMEKFKGRVEQSEEASECPVCLEPLHKGEQVLLSCTHSFHRKCLTSYESFAGVRCCPVCRCTNYQKRRVEDAKKAHLDNMATIIQAAWRGHRQRRRFIDLKRKHGLAAVSDPAVRRRWGADVLSGVGSDVARQVTGASDGLDRMFAELDASVGAARRLTDEALERALARRLGASASVSQAEDDRRRREAEARRGAGAEAGGAERPPFRISGPPRAGSDVRRADGAAAGPGPGPGLAGTGASVGVHGSGGQPRRGASTSALLPPAAGRAGGAPQGRTGAGAAAGPGPGSVSGGVAGSAARAAAPAVGRPRLVDRRSLGMGLGVPEDGGPPTGAAAYSSEGGAEAVDPESVPWDRVIGRALDRNDVDCAICMCALSSRPRTAWLSCSHVFHAECIESFEIFEVSRGGVCRCPMCRNAYVKKVTAALSNRTKEQPQALAG